jgi:hypothetical protein
MLQILPFGAWIATVTSLVFLVVFWTSGELGRVSAVAHAAWFLAAAYLQFFGPSLIAGAVGLALQTVLAVYLLVRWRWSL